MTRGQHVALRRWQRHRRGSIYRAATIMGDVFATAETVGAALDRFRRRPKWAKRNVAGYARDWMDDLLGTEPEPIVILEPTSAPIPEFIPEMIRRARELKSYYAWKIDIQSIDDSVRSYAKMYYGILNHTMSEEVARQEIERIIVADHDAVMSIEVMKRIPTMIDTREVVLLEATVEEGFAGHVEVGRQRIVGPYIANPEQIHPYSRDAYRDSNRRHG